MTWTDLDRAIVAAVRAGLPGVTVLWEDQTVPRPALPYLSLRRVSKVGIGGVPELRVEDNPDGHPGDPEAIPPVIGTEILVQRAKPSEIVLRIQAFTAPTVGDACAQALLDALENALDLDGPRAALEDAGLALVEVGTIQNLSGLVETKIEGRASLDLRLRHTDGAAEAATYIETATASPL